MIVFLFVVVVVQVVFFDFLLWDCEVWFVYCVLLIQIDFVVVCVEVGCWWMVGGVYFVWECMGFVLVIEKSWMVVVIEFEVVVCDV